MKKTKCRYTCKKNDGFEFSEVFTDEEIKSGDVEKWYEKNNVNRINCQFVCSKWTGLIDRNKVEIFEDDVLEDGVVSVCDKRWK